MDRVTVRQPQQAQYNVQSYNDTIGRSYTEWQNDRRVEAESRSCTKCQNVRRVGGVGSFPLTWKSMTLWQRLRVIHRSVPIFITIALIHYLYHYVIFNTMIEIILSIVVITIALSAMSIGLLFNKPLKGSCGGQDGICTVCGIKTGNGQCE